MDDEKNGNLPAKSDTQGGPEIIRTPDDVPLPEREESVEPWEEGSRTQGFQNGGWDYLHRTPDVAGSGSNAEVGGSGGTGSSGGDDDIATYNREAQR